MTERSPLLDQAVHVVRCALADLEGILPDYDSDGNRQHPAWTTMKEMIQFLRDAGQDTAEYKGRYPYLGRPFVVNADEDEEVTA